MGGRNNIKTIAWVFLVMCLGSGCTKPALRVGRPIGSAAVIPFFQKTPPGEGGGLVEDPISGRLLVAGQIVPNARRELTDLIYLKLADFPQLDLVPLREVEGAVRTGEFEGDPIRSAQRIGEAFGVDGVLLGWVFRYEERIGSAIAVERPASVSFAIHLVGVKEDRVLWRGFFQETQQPLSENILKFTAFLRRRGRWLTAKDLASVGMDEVLVSFPASREGPEPEGE
ncbi:MAG: hypothetical protein KAJ09_04710 [Deltaproteobacteria bacterium]|nr:hypothetical protein [Deltaproteobacteria bacterium]